MDTGFKMIWFGMLTLVVTVLFYQLEGQPPPLPAAPAPTTRSVTLAWDPSPDTNVVRYRVYWGPAKRQYTNYLETPQTMATISGLRLPQYFAATAVASNGLESDFSNEVGGQPVLIVTPQESEFVSGPWSNSQPVLVITNPPPGPRFFRLTITNQWQ